MQLSSSKSSRTLVVLVTAAIILVLAVFNFGSWSFINRIEDWLEDELATRLKAVAKMGAELVEDSDFPQFYANQQRLLSLLSLPTLIENPPAEIDVQRLMLIDRSMRVLAGSDTLLMPVGRTAIHLFDDSLAIKKSWQGITAVSDIHESEGARFMNAFAPVYDRLTGELICLLVVEANADFFNLLLNFKQGLVVGGIASAVVLVIFALFLGSAMRYFLRTQEELRRSERLASMGQMAATVAHEIRNPLSIIKNTSEVLQQKYEQPDRPDELFEFIPSEVRRLSRLVNDFLSFARDRELNRREGDLLQTVKRAVDMVRKEEQARDIEWHIDTGESGLNASYDEDSILQVLINLLLNAAQAMNGSGRIDLRIARCEGRAENICIDIKDNGPGLPDSFEKLLEPFYTTKTLGSGLGLAVAKQFIDKHGGRLTAESEKGKGTTIHIELPAR